MSLSKSSFSKERMSLFDKILYLNWFYIILITLIAGVGFMCLYSASGGNLDPWAKKHAMRFAAGMCGFLIVALIDIRLWLKFAYWIYGIVFLLLIAVEIKGQMGMGAQRWINLGFMLLQPSEVMKVAVALALAKFFSNTSLDDVQQPLFLIKPVMFALAPTALVLMQPDLGTALMIMMVAGAVFFLAGVSYWMFGVIFAAAAAAIPIAWQFLHDYQKQRVLTFMNPEDDPLGSGYHIMQSKIALGSGGLTGKGFLQGSQSRLNFLPEKQTDFIFTLFAEEWGLMGGIALLTLFAITIFYGMLMGLRCQNQFGRLLTLGITVNFSLYIFINIAMVMGLIPVVGVPLPMVSNGGTAMMSALFGFGLIMSVYVHRDIKIGRRF